MPELLSEMNNMSMISPHIMNDGLPRYSNPPQVQPSYQNWTMIDDVFSCQTALPPGSQSNYLMQGTYNSNGIIPAYHQAVCPSSAEQAMWNLSLRTPSNNLYVPNEYQTGQSFASNVAGFNAAHPQYIQAVQNPPFAGGKPLMKDAKALDESTPLREGFHFANEEASRSCLECLRHTDGCKLCQKMTQQSTTKYWVVIAILILIIIGLLGYIWWSKRKTVSVKPSLFTSRTY